MRQEPGTVWIVEWRDGTTWRPAWKDYMASSRAEIRALRAEASREYPEVEFRVRAYSRVERVR